MVKGVNTATSNAQRVKVGDYGSQITIQLDNIENDALQAVEWVRAYSVNDPVVSQYVDIPDHTVVDGTLFITLPEITRGTYNIEIKDTDGRIYPAEGTLRLEMLPSTKDASEVYYVTYRELILEDVTPIITGYLTDNPDSFKGEKGDTTAAPPKVFTRAEYDALPSKSADTLYIVKEVE